MRTSARRGFGWVAPLVLVGLSAAWTPAAQEHPLPEQEAFFRETQENLERARRAQFWFAYKERETELRRNPFGRVGTGGTKTFSVWPELDPPTIVRRLIAEDGTPVEDGDVERIELETRRRDEDDEPSRSGVEDTIAVLRFTMDRRERMDGRDTVVVRFEPRPDEEPQTREGEWAQDFAGEIWIDEASREVTRVEATTLDSISLGLGLIARLGKGATVTLERGPVDGDVWMPSSVTFQGEGRAFLFLRRLDVNHVVEWFDYDHLTREEVERASAE
jgi:hypothetical protein